MRSHSLVLSHEHVLRNDDLSYQVLCPFMLDQFYWAERMFWIGVAPEPLKRSQLLPDKDEGFCIREAAEVVARVINSALSVEVRARALDIAKTISSEVRFNSCS